MKDNIVMVRWFMPFLFIYLCETQVHYVIIQFGHGREKRLLSLQETPIFTERFRRCDAMFTHH